MNPKSKLFALYLGQKVHYVQGYEEAIIVGEYLKDYLIENDYLLLRGITDLTDGEKRIVADMSYYGSSSNLNIVDQLFEKYLKKQTILSGEQWWFIQDYLRSIGIALPMTYLKDKARGILN